MIRRSLATTLAAFAMFSAVATPAAAGGSFSISILPGSERDAQMLRGGMQLYSMYKDIRGAGITQRGRGNSAGVAQDGRGNLGIVHQEGRGHNGTISQRGDNNAHALFQFGRNTSANIDQRGHGQTGATFQWGW